MVTQHQRAAWTRRLTSGVDSRLRGNDGLKVGHYLAFRPGPDEPAAALAMVTIRLVAVTAAVIEMVRSS